MKAVVINRYGSPEVMHIEELEKPVISPDEVLIKVHCSSVNPVDWKIRNGSLRYFLRTRFPLILGFDVAGEIVEAGSSVKRFKTGDRVFCMFDFKHIGAYAEYVSAREEHIALIPENLSFQEAAAVPLAGLTAYQALYDKGEIKSSDSVLINGASGGVGSFAVQIARAAGATVTAVCSTRNIELVRNLGAESVIDYTKQDVSRSPDNYDIIFDAVGKLTFFRLKKKLKNTGRYITTLPNQFSNAVSFFLTPFLSLFGYQKKSAFISVKPDASDLKSLAMLLKEGTIVPLMDRTYTLEEIQEAHAYSEKGRAKGKIVINIS
jgi:2-desacetyl-2-hydroxyethyl bacteriochlorophyllide A dehydrogenase